MNDKGIVLVSGFLMFAWLVPLVAIQIHKDRMRARLRRQIARMRRERMMLLFKRREARNAARLARELGL